MLGRDVFTRRPLPTEDQAKHVHDVGLGDLLDALQEALKKAEPELVHEIVLEQISLRERVGLVLDLLRERGRVSFTELFSAETSRLQILVTFLASLELVPQPDDRRAPNSPLRSHFPQPGRQSGMLRYRTAWNSSEPCIPPNSKRLSKA